MDLLPLGFNLDGSIPLQEQLASKLKEMINLQSEEKRLRLWAGRKGLIALRASIQILRSKYPQPWLTFLGSGDLHHVTLLLLETLSREIQPVTLVLIDNHPDWYTGWPRYHCGNWVSEVLRFPWIQSVFMIGQDSTDLRDLHFWGLPFRDLLQGRVRLYPYVQRCIRVPFRWPSRVLGALRTVRRFYGVDLYFDTVSNRGSRNLFDELSQQLEGKNIYISIDKDCLETRAAVTDWEQGRLPLKDLLEGVAKLMRACQVIGADVCGEQAPRALQGILKRWDAGRVGQRFSPSVLEVSRLNEQTNLQVLETFLTQRVETRL